MRSSYTLISFLSVAIALLQGCLSPEATREIEGLSGREGTGITMTRLPRVLSIISTYDATECQKIVAEKRARHAVEILETQVRPAEKKPEPSAEKPDDKPAAVNHAESQTTPKATEVVIGAWQSEVEDDVTSVKAPKSKSQDDNLPRYIAVDTEPDERLQGDKVIMLWDRKGHSLVGEKIYDVKRPPERDEIVLWDNKYRAQYVGGGT